MIHSLKTKLILAFSVVAIASIALIVIYANLDSTRQVQNYMNRGGMYGLNNLVLRLESYFRSEGTWDGIDHDISMGKMIQNRRNNQGGVTSVALLDKNLVVVWSDISKFTIGDPVQGTEIESAVQLQDANENIVGYLIVDEVSSVTANDISPFVTRLRGIVLITGLVAALVAIGMAILISNYLLKPVNELTIASHRLSSGDLTTRVKITGGDELAVLGKTFNQMATNLENSEERKKALTSDIAHELRTPLAVQRAQIEAMMDGINPIDKENLAIVANQTDFLSRMVDDLRLLALADAGEVRFEFQEVQVDDFIKKVVDQFRAQAQSDATGLNLEIDKTVIGKKITTDPDRLTQIMHNLIANALRYGKKGGEIKVLVCSETPKTIFTIKDDGNGIPATSLPHIFDRFYRHEKARSRETGGTGLGLAISKKLADLLGGDLTGGNHPEGGAVFTLVIPDNIS